METGINPAELETDLGPSPENEGAAENEGDHPQIATVRTVHKTLDHHHQGKGTEETVLETLDHQQGKGTEEIVLHRTRTGETDPHLEKHNQ